MKIMLLDQPGGNPSRVVSEGVSLGSGSLSLRERVRVRVTHAAAVSNTPSPRPSPSREREKTGLRHERAEHKTQEKLLPSGTRQVVVGHVIYAFKDGGMERGLLNIINYGDYDRFRHVIICLTEAGAFAKQLRSPSCAVVELRKKEGNDFSLPFRIAAIVLQRHVDLLHARGWPTLVETAMAARLAGVRMTIYGFHGKTMGDLQGLSLRRRWIQKIAVRCYQRVLTLNSRMRSDFATECGLREDRIHIIDNGVDVDTFRPCEDRGALRTKFGLPADRFIIGNVARLDPVKNHEVILRALHRMQSDACMPFFLLVGEGENRGSLERKIADWHLAADVRLFGYSDNIPGLLNCMDLYIQSSFYEGFSNTIVEAMACGLPVLASDTGGSRGLFSEEQAGCFFQPQDDETLTALILRLQKESFSRRTLAEQARRRAVEHFSVHAMVRGYEALYQELAARATR